MITLSSTSVNTSRIGWTRYNKIWYRLQGDTAFPTYSSYEVLFEVSFLGGGVVFSQRQSPDKNGQFFFEVNQILEDLIQERFFANDSQLPTFQQASPRITEQPFLFILKFTEYIDKVAVTIIEQSLKAISSGLDYDDFSHQKQRDWLFLNHKFFTSTSDPKPAMLDVEDYLYFCNTYNFQFFDIWVEIRYKDNTVGSYIAYTNFDSEKKTIIIPVGYNELNIENNRDTNKLLEGWRVWVTKHNDSNARASEPINYKLDYEFNLEKRKFLFGNSLGGYETFYCKAKIEEQITSKKTVNKRLYGQDYRLRDGENFAGNQDGKRKFEVATGWLSKEFADALQDAAISKEVWEITEKGFIPVIVESISAVYYEKNNELIGYVFVGSYAYEVDLYTKEIERKADGLPAFEPEPTYNEVLLLHYRGLQPLATFKPVIELNEKIDNFSISSTFGIASQMNYKYSEAANPDFNVLPLLTYAQLLALIANGSGSLKIEINPTFLLPYSEATFRFSYEKFGIAPAISWTYNFANTNSVDIVIPFKDKVFFTSISNSANTIYQIQTNENLDFSDLPFILNVNDLNTAIGNLAIGVDYNILVLNLFNQTLTFNYFYL